MKCLYLLLICCLLTSSCTSTIQDLPPAPTIPSQPVATSDNFALTIIEESARFDVFAVVRTNASYRVNFSNAISLLNTDLNTSNYDTITLINTLEASNNVVIQNIRPTLALLSYYVTNNNDGKGGYNALKLGIQKGLSQ